MGVRVGAIPVSAFVAIIIAVLLIGITVSARRRGHLESRGALIAVAVIVALLIIYGMAVGLIPGWSS
ncbi:MAG TPA: hypothetical protein VE221_00875 [Sphingomicrobium sp.]|jgi:hypothetical protein|nr:hypothetical protein [Sphingomicrobium sp.]